MTEPDPIAALAAQVDQLRKAVEKSQATVTAWDARLRTEGPGASMVVLSRLKQFGQRLDEAIAKHQTKPPPAPWWCVDQAEGEVMLAELRGWVDTFLRPHYPGYASRLPACVLNHPEAVWELSTLRAEWERIYADAGNRDLAGALAWHDRYLPGVLARLKDAIQCDEGGCRLIRRPLDI
jgi:hypothetical protein